MIPTAIARSSSYSLRNFMRPSVRTRRIFTSSFFLVTFCGAVVTVSLTTLLPCPARVAPGQYKRRSERTQGSYVAAGAELQCSSRTPRTPPSSALVQGERVRLTRKGGWIEIDE